MLQWRGLLLKVINQYSLDFVYLFRRRDISSKRDLGIWRHTQLYFTRAQKLRVLVLGNTCLRYPPITYPLLSLSSHPLSRFFDPLSLCNTRLWAICIAIYLPFWVMSDRRRVKSGESNSVAEQPPSTQNKNLRGTSREPSVTFSLVSVFARMTRSISFSKMSK